jgi:hypothetical protein
MTTQFPPKPRFLNLSKKEECQDKTLVFLCARKSSGSELNKEHFDNLLKSLKQSERCTQPSLSNYLLVKIIILFYLQNRGRFGKFNRPGLPASMEVVGKFVARTTATSSIASRYERTNNSEPDWLPMTLLAWQYCSDWNVYTFLFHNFPKSSGIAFCSYVSYLFINF